MQNDPIARKDDCNSLRDKIEIIYKYNPTYAPEFSSLTGNEDVETLSKMYKLALSRVNAENYSQHKSMLETILPLFEVVESRKADSGTAIIAGFMLMSVQGTIKGHLETLSNLKERNNIEEQCLGLCQKISSLKSEEALHFFPLFKEYLVILIEHHDEITAPLSFEDPSKLVKDIYTEGSPEIMPLMIGQSCLII